MRPTVTELLPGILAVPVPDEIKNAHFYRVNNESIMLKWDDVNHPLNPYDVVRVDKHYGDLEDYKWPEILFTTKDCNEEQARKLVKSHYSRQASFNPDLGHYQTSGSTTTYMDYVNGYCTLKKPTESLQSLLRSHNLTGKNYLLIKKQP